MSTSTRTTARSEIFDAAVANGFTVRCDENVHMSVRKRTYPYSTDRFVTRFLIERTDEHKGLGSSGNRAFTVLFTETDAFDSAYHAFGDTADAQPWMGSRRNPSLTKAKLLQTLANQNPERLLSLKAKRLADDIRHFEIKLTEAEALLANAHLAVADAYAAARVKLREGVEFFGAPGASTDGQVTNLLDSLVGSEVFLAIHNAKALLSAREAGVRVAQDDLARHQAKEV